MYVVRCPLLWAILTRPSFEGLNVLLVFIPVSVPPGPPMILYYAKPHSLVGFQFRRQRPTSPGFCLSVPDIAMVCGSLTVCGGSLFPSHYTSSKVACLCYRRAVSARWPNTCRPSQCYPRMFMSS
jgi:hypothetical protein